MKEKEKTKRSKNSKKRTGDEAPPASLDQEISEQAESSMVLKKKRENKEETTESSASVLTSELDSLQEERQAKKSFLATTIVVSTIIGLLAGVVGGVYLAPLFKTSVIGMDSGSQGSQVQKVVLDEESAVIDVVKQANPAVVSIIISKDLPKLQDFFFNPFGDDESFGTFGFKVPSQESELRQVGAGSGFIVSSDGLIMTNKHVVEDEEAAYTVVTSDGRRYEGRVLARDPLNDLAVIKIDAKDLPTLQLGDSNEVVLGQRVVAIGNTLGELSNTVTTGVVSGIGRTISAGDGFGQVLQLDEVIQTDAAINPGNSGGPLLNLAGQVIGVNTAIDRQGQLVGFAIPSNEAKKVLDDVRRYGRVLRPYIGIRYVLINEDFAKDNNLAVDHGALIIPGKNEGEKAVVPGSPAEKAGLQANDIILEINGQVIDQNNSLIKRLKSFRPGDQVVLKILRDGEEKEILLTLGERE